jgi:hypothetical protein
MQKVVRIQFVRYFRDHACITTHQFIPYPVRRVRTQELTIITILYLRTVNNDSVSNEIQTISTTEPYMGSPSVQLGVSSEGVNLDMPYYHWTASVV